MKNKFLSALLFCAFSAINCLANDFEEIYIAPARIVWVSDTSNVHNVEALMRDFPGQVSLKNAGDCVVMTNNGTGTPSILIDFGKEIYGSLKIFTGFNPKQTSCKVRICLGESVSEAMSNTDIPNNPKNPTNEHSLRDFDAYLPWLGSLQTGKSGFRFARIDLPTKGETLALRYVNAIASERNLDQVGSFASSDPRIDKIWDTGAYTVKLCMQEYVWDGVKRDRLVWLGDMHPELMTSLAVWGDTDVFRKSLDFARDDTPLPGWINDFSAYSLWWLMQQYELYMYSGNMDALQQNIAYIEGLVDMVTDRIDSDGNEKLDGARFLDWPSARDEEAIHSGLQSLTAMAMDAAAQLGKYAANKSLETKALANLAKLQKAGTPIVDSKQAAALAIISGMSKDVQKDAQIILKDGPDRFSTFYGYYMLEALAQSGHTDEALQILSDYWGGMIDLGATTFWEDFTWSDKAKSHPITEFTPEGEYDIHADGGDHCYVGLRLSMCHGWASGPTPWLTKNVLGVKILKPGFKEVAIEPNLCSLDHVSGTVPTPKGPIHIEAHRTADGKIVKNIKAPKGVKVK